MIVINTGGACAPIGVFDSGLGGMTAVRALTALLPHEDIVYFGDTGRVPYGSRSRETICRYAKQDEDFLLSKGVKLIIAACGTVSSVAAEESAALPVPFIGVVEPSAQAAAKASRNGRVGVIGTAATVASQSFPRALARINPALSVFSESCPLFVPLVEEGWISSDDPVAVAAARRYLQPLKEQNIDTLILGCTHFPLLSGIISQVMGDSVVLIDTGHAAAEAARAYLAEQDLLNPSGGECSFFVSDRPAGFSRLAGLFLGKEIESVTRVEPM